MLKKLKDISMNAYLDSLETIAATIHTEKNVEKVVFFILLNIIDKLNFGFTEGYFLKYNKQNKTLRHINSYFKDKNLTEEDVKFLIDSLEKGIPVGDEFLENSLKNIDIEVNLKSFDGVENFGLLKRFSNFTIIPIYHHKTYYGCFILCSNVESEFEFTPQEMQILELFKYNFSQYLYTKELENHELENIRLQTVGSFATAIIHELRTPISSIVGFAALAKKKLDDPEKVKIYLDYIVKESNNLVKLCGDVDEYSNDIVKNETTIFKLSSVIRKALDNLKQHLEKSKIKVYFLVEKDLKLYCNEQKLITAFNHIVKNSIENCDFEKDYRYIQIVISSDKKEVITIRDNGIGIQEDLINQVTTPFYSSKLYGTGLGLTIAQEAFKKSNLEFSIKSEHTKWTEITLIKE
ncbi:MAG: HAMP domain-containing histidine kinase [Psychrilyobacter sp.]|nr:HAMP domain-containing histidine kinase [Psychrilyobacter sp.]